MTKDQYNAAHYCRTSILRALDEVPECLEQSAIWLRKALDETDAVIARYEQEERTDPPRVIEPKPRIRTCDLRAHRYWIEKQRFATVPDPTQTPS